MKLAIALLALLALTPVGAHGDHDPIQLTIVAMDNYFLVNGQETENPTVPIHAGGTYDITFVNEGEFPHDFHLDFDGDGTSDWAITKSGLYAKGEGGSKSVTVPGNAKSGFYWCSAHGTGTGAAMAGPTNIISEGGEDSPGAGVLLAGMGVLVAVAVARRF